jgi:hypothetical protein
MYGDHVLEWNRKGSIFGKFNADILEVQIKNFNFIINSFTDIDYNVDSLLGSDHK